MSNPLTYSRVVVGFCHPGFSDDLVKRAADVAGLLNLDLDGLFINTLGLSEAAKLGSVREFRILEQRWTPFDVDDLSRQIGFAAQRAQKLLAKFGKQPEKTRHFEVVDTSLGETSDLGTCSSDIFIMSEPGSLAEQYSGAYQEMVSAAIDTSSSVMLLPRRPMRSRGSILALTEAQCENCITAAEMISKAMDEHLVVMPTTDLPQGAFKALEKSRGLKERMIVLSWPTGRGESRRDWLTLLSTRQVPILIVPESVANGE